MGDHRVEAEAGIHCCAWVRTRPGVEARQLSTALSFLGCSQWVLVHLPGTGPVRGEGGVDDRWLLHCFVFSMSLSGTMLAGDKGKTEV